MIHFGRPSLPLGGVPHARETLAILIRPLEAHDHDGARVIERATASPVAPRTLNEFTDMMHHRNRHGARDTFGLVAVYDGYLVGAAAWRLAPRCLDLLMFRTHPTAVRYGVGTQLMGGVYGEMTGYHHRLLAIVPESRLAGLVFLRRMGWRSRDPDPVIRGHFGDEDGIIMVYRRAAPGMGLLGRGWEA